MGRFLEDFGGLTFDPKKENSHGIFGALLRPFVELLEKVFGKILVTCLPIIFTTDFYTLVP